MAEQKLAVSVVTACFAIAYGDELGLAGEPRTQFAGQRCPLPGIAAADAQHQQSRDCTLPELVDENLLAGAGVCRQEERHVGREAAVPDDRRAGEHRHRPENEGTEGGDGHCSGRCSMLITARSPSACRYSMLWMRLRWPAILIF
ncbi:MAG: hypothetical protein CAPSK01_001060 [Candidatus Accumulibacter vicinus]|uniref:Uncharacterized protein n=1 Tax=Candidatus Accumulibacter vicinus TaxID=2954382 RepID=A0A084Y3M0_9PROT|nr:MAG: hypothetical protein CAPSK01_001060 [Candidatus Accumulibacter vicinus]